MSATGRKAGFFNDRMFPVLFMFIVTAIFITAVSGVYLSTQGTIKLNEGLFLKRAILSAAGVEAPPGAAELDALYQARIRQASGPQGTYYEVLGEGGSAATGYVVHASGPGLWGTIRAVIGFDERLDRLTGIDFVEQSETPGLGARITENWFRAQFRGKSGPFTFVREGEPAGPHEFDAITGATITSTAVRDIVNTTQKEVAQIVSR